MVWTRRRPATGRGRLIQAGVRDGSIGSGLVIDLRADDVVVVSGSDVSGGDGVFSRLVGRFRGLIRVVVDVGAWLVGFVVAWLLRFDFSFDGWSLNGIAALFGLAAFLQLSIGSVVGLYAGRWRFGSFEEVAAVVRATVLVGVPVVLVDAWFSGPRLVPLSVAAGGTVVALVMQLGVRYLWRLFLEVQNRPGANAERVLVFGGGEGGDQLITSMLRNPHSPYRPVALLDDDPAKRKLRLRGVPVVGGRHDLARVAQAHKAKHLVIAMPGASPLLLRELSTRALDADLKVSVIPAVESLLGDKVQTDDVRPLNERDLLGRGEVTTNVDQIAGYIAGQRVLVTGAGGSIGSELCRQIHRFGPAQLVMLDRDESALHAVQLSIEGQAMLDQRNLVVADIRDPGRLRQVFVEHQPQVVFHAAALKHLPLLEMYPEEAIKTNVVGTLNLLDIATEANVERFVNISTDKAADPTSVLGYTKRIAERLTAQTATKATGTYLSVRFGNVLGSRGSVLTSFRHQIADGGPITVTHPEVSRYFMTIEEAVQLVIQAGAIGRSGEALVLDMGAPVKIADVARRMAAHADQPIKIQYTGLRPGEKLHEVLLGTNEQDTRPVHPLISHTPVPPLQPNQITNLTPTQLPNLANPNTTPQHWDEVVAKRKAQRDESPAAVNQLRVASEQSG